MPKALPTELATDHHFLTRPENEICHLSLNLPWPELPSWASFIECPMPELATEWQPWHLRLGSICYRLLCET